MIVMRIQAQVIPDKRSEFLAAIGQEVAPSREFAGCATYVWSEDALQPNHFSLYEEWETVQAAQDYKNSAHFQQIGKALFPLLTEHPTSAYYQGERVEIP